MQMSNGELLEWALRIDNFSQAIFVEDSVDNWTNARELGHYLVQVDSALLFGHLLLTRACRHLGELDKAMEEARLCRAIIEREDLGAEVSLVHVLEEEEKHLSLRVRSR
jgi:hypothetical protein